MTTTAATAPVTGLDRPDRRGGPDRRGRWLVPTFVGVTILALPLAYLTLFSVSPRGYDDEGFFLVMLKLVASGKRLYDDVPNGYGPVYDLVFVPLWHLLGGIGHDRGRMIVLVLWLAGCWTCGWAVFRFTGSLVVAVVAFVVCFRVMAIFDAEPMNPGPLVNLEVGALLVVAAGAAPTRRTLALLAALVAVIGLTKVNVGAFAACALLFAIVAVTPRRPAVTAAFLALLSIVLPVGLMRPDLGHVWGFAALVAASGIAVTVAAVGLPVRIEIRLRTALGVMLAAGFATAAVLCVLTALFLGSTVTGLWNGIVGLASTQRDIFAVFPLIHLRPTLIALVALIPLVIATRRGRAPLWSGLLRLGCVLAVGIVSLTMSFVVSSPALLDWGPPMAFLAALPDPRPGMHDRARFGRILVAALAVFAALYAYPVAGSQARYAALPLIVAAGIVAADGARVVARYGLRDGSSIVARVAVAFTVAVTVWAAAFQLLPSAWARFERESPLHLPGANNLRTSDLISRRAHWVVAHLKPCSTFIPLLGMNSMYLWSGISPPGFMQQNWPVTLTLAQQAKILRVVRPDPHVCLLVNFDTIGFWTQGRPLPPTPLVNFTRTEFRPAAISPDGDQIWHRRPLAPGARH